VKMDAKSVHQWTKLYRVFEQSIISNVVRLWRCHTVYNSNPHNQSNFPTCSRFALIADSSCSAFASCLASWSFCNSMISINSILKK
jgi:hypothetical protein